MNIWIFNNYNMLPSQGGLNRHYYLAKHLKEKGHNPVVFVGSHLHNTDVQMIQDRRKYVVDMNQGFPWVYVKTCKYSNSKLKRLLSMFQYYANAERAIKDFSVPDVVLGSSAHPLAAVLAIKLKKKYACKSIVEVRDFWPESLIAYGIAKRKNILIVALRVLEKWLYKKADSIIFTMEGAYDYIIEQGWEKEVPREKVHFINNGVDLEQFDYNRDHFRIDDADLDDPDIFKVVYTGSIRKVNNLGLLLDAAKLVREPKIRFLIWGDGNEREALEQRLRDEKIGNVVFKGKVEKKCIPSIVSRADLNYAHNTPSPLFRFGISFNKIFDYFAAGKPILCDFPSKSNPAVRSGAAMEVQDATAKNVAETVVKMHNMNPEVYAEMCHFSRQAANQYCFSKLTERLVEIMGDKTAGISQNL